MAGSHSHLLKITSSFFIVFPRPNASFAGVGIAFPLLCLPEQGEATPTPSNEVFGRGNLNFRAFSSYSFVTRWRGRHHLETCVTFASLAQENWEC